MSSKRQQIIDEIRSRATTILTRNGYSFDAGNNVKEWQTTPLSQQELPAILIRDEIEETDAVNPNSGLYDRKLRIQIDLVLAEKDQSATNARKALTDLITFVGKDPKWNSLARRSMPNADSIAVDEEGQRVSGAKIEFTVEYGRKPWEA